MPQARSLNSVWPFTVFVAGSENQFRPSVEPTSMFNFNNPNQVGNVGRTFKCIECSTQPHTPLDAVDRQIPYASSLSSMRAAEIFSTLPGTLARIFCITQRLFSTALYDRHQGLRPRRRLCIFAPHVHAGGYVLFFVVLNPPLSLLRATLRLLNIRQLDTARHSSTQRHRISLVVHDHVAAFTTRNHCYHSRPVDWEVKNLDKKELVSCSEAVKNTPCNNTRRSCARRRVDGRSYPALGRDESAGLSQQHNERKKEGCSLCASPILFTCSRVAMRGLRVVVRYCTGAH